VNYFENVGYVDSKSGNLPNKPRGVLEEVKETQRNESKLVKLPLNVVLNRIKLRS
jgi:hypothetical protein